MGDLNPILTLFAVWGPLFLTALTIAAIILLILLLGRTRPVDISGMESALAELLTDLRRVERSFLDELGRNRSEAREAAEAQRREAAEQLDRFGGVILARAETASQAQRERLDAFGVKIDALVVSTEAKLDQIRDTQEKGAAELRKELTESAAVQAKSQAERLDGFAGRIDNFAKVFAERTDAVAKTTEARLDAVREGLQQKTDQMRIDLVQALKLGREESQAAQKLFREALEASLARLSESSEKRQAELKALVEARLDKLREENSQKLEQMRKTVDEQLHGALEKRLGESFKLVGERLEQVHKGLGEMQTLAQGVGDLKRVLVNVKTRGSFGEVQLERLLEQILSPTQFIKNAVVKEHSREMVEFAVRVSGREEDESEVLLPIDSKFPIEDYELLLAAVETGDPAAVETHGKALEARVKLFARDLSEKYINPPTTTPFAILFLPSEGLYAEMLRRPGLVETLHRDYRVVPSGPTTLAALLSSLKWAMQIGQIQKRSEEVWKVLGAVKSEFRKFGESVDKVRKTLSSATSNLEKVSTRSRAMERQLRKVAELPEAEAKDVLGVEALVEPADLGEDGEE